MSVFNFSFTQNVIFYLYAPFCAKKGLIRLIVNIAGFLRCLCTSVTIITLIRYLISNMVKMSYFTGNRKWLPLGKGQKLPKTPISLFTFAALPTLSETDTNPRNWLNTHLWTYMGNVIMTFAQEVNLLRLIRVYKQPPIRLSHEPFVYPSAQWTFYLKGCQKYDISPIFI